MDGSSSFGEWLRSRRTALQLSREQLAQRVGCATVTLRKIEADERRPSVQLAERLAVVLDVPPAAQPTFVSVARAGLPLDSLSPPASGYARESPATMRGPSTPPRGTVTFLFSDIADNAQLWIQHPQTMHDVLSRYTAILQQSISAKGGSILKMSGDVVGAAFANPLDAITVALAAQRALGAEAWGPIGALAVRIVVHTGVVAEPTDAYVGGSASWAKQLLASSHGHQILLSQVTQELLRDQLPASVALRDLGTYCLGDSNSPEHLFQLIVPDLPAAFPPLRSPARRPHNLPMPPTPLIGREQDVAAVVAALRREEARLITLIGPGGVGKTRLALQAAVELRDAFAHGVFLVDLSTLHDPAFAVPAIAHALGVTEVDGQPLLTRLRDFVATKHLLLLLDNFEQVLPAAEELATLLAVAPQLKLLVTSRAALHLAGEHEFPVAPLPWRDERETLNAEQAHAVSSAFSIQRSAFPPAVTLFFQRAQAVKPDFAMAPDTAALVEQICQCLDGLPLAIELAAARIKLFPLAALLQRLDHRLALLTGGARDLPARHQTLRAAIDWSYQLLENQAQTLLQRLAVFVGGFTLEAAETVCGDQNLKMEDGRSRMEDRSFILDLPSPMLDGLAALVDHSLLSPAQDSGGAPRFTLLDTIREYALERLELSGDARELRQRHAAYFLQLAEQIEPELQGSDMRPRLDRLEVEHANLRAALTWALGQGMVELAARLASALTVFWDVRHRREGRDWLDAVLTSGAPLTPAVRAKTLHAAGWLARALYDRATGIALLEESLALYRALGDEHGYTTTLTELGWTIVSSGGDTTRAIALLEAGLARYRALGDQRGIALALHGLGWAEQQRALGDRQGIIGMLTGLGWVERRHGSLDAARALHAECLAVRRAAGDVQGIAWSLYSLGVIAGAQGDYAEARAYQQERLAVERSLNNHHGVADALRSLGMLAFRQGDHDAARAWLVEGLHLARAIGDTFFIAFALIGLSEVAQAAGDYARATALLEEALVHFGVLGDSHRMARVYAMMAQVALDGQDDGTAHSMAMQSVQLARSVDDPETISACLAGMADSAARQGKAIWAARLWGAAERQGEDPKAYRAPVAPPNHSQLLATVRAALGESAFAAVWAAGRALTPEEALAAPDIGGLDLAATGAGSTSPHAAPKRPAGLTQRELEVLLLVAEGLSNGQIAERLVISVATVKTYLSAIYDKLGVLSRTAAMRYVIDHRLQ